MIGIKKKRSETTLQLVPANVSASVPVVGKSIKVSKNKWIRNAYSKAYKFKDNLGWVKSESYLPMELDLVMLKTESGEVHYGWLTGARKWCGRTLKQDMNIVSWKQMPENICH